MVDYILVRMREESVLFRFNDSPITAAPPKSVASRKKKEITTITHHTVQHMHTNITRIPLIANLVITVLVVINSTKLSALKVHSEITITIININHTFM